MGNLELAPAMYALRPSLQSIVEAIEIHAPYGAALLSNRQGLVISVDDNEELVNELPPAAGTVLSAFDGIMMHEKAVFGFSKPVVERLAGELGAGVGFSHSGASQPLDLQLGPGVHQDFSATSETGQQPLSVEEKLARCHDLHDRLRKLDEHIINVQIYYLERDETSVFCNRKSDLAQRVQRLVLHVYVLVSGPAGVRYDYLSKSTTRGWDDLAFTDEELRILVDNAIALLTAERIEPGEYTLITSPGVTGTICHESFGHGVETDMFLKQRARAAHYIDLPVGSPLVNILDDPSIPGAFGSYFFDDEGWLAGPTRIVEDGIFRRGITDFYSAQALKIPRSANGRRQDYSRKAYARMSNTFFAPGITPVEDLFAQVDHGIYLQKWSSGMEDPLGWGIQVTCHYGREIRDGKVTGRVFAPVGITGYVPDLLRDISAVGNDWNLDGGNCGKGYKEYLTVSSGGPHLLTKARLG